MYRQYRHIDEAQYSIDKSLMRCSDFVKFVQCLIDRNEIILLDHDYFLHNWEPVASQSRTVVSQSHDWSIAVNNLRTEIRLSHHSLLSQSSARAS